MDSSYSYSYTADSVNASAAGTAAFAGIMVFVGIIWLIGMALAIISIVALWKIFVKAGKPGWAVIVPIYNIIVLCEIVGRPAWWVLLFFVPIANIFVAVALSIDLAKSFGKDIAFGILTAFVSFVGLSILGFGKSRYVGPVALGTDMFSSFSSGPQPIPAAPGAGVPTPPPATQPFTPQPPAPDAGTSNDTNKTI